MITRNQYESALAEQKAGSTTDAVGNDRVILLEDSVHLLDLIEEDPQVFAVVGTSSDAEAAVHDLLRIGAQAVSLASIRMDTRAVEERFESMSGDFEDHLERAVEAITKSADSLLSEDNGALRVILTDLRSGLEGLLAETFDPNSKKSAVAKIEDSMRVVSDQLSRNLRGVFNLDESDSPLARTKREMVEAMKSEVKSVLDEVKEVRLALTANAAAKTVSTKLTAKGFDFEDALYGAFDAVAGSHCDVLEAVGRSFGGSGTMKGDLLVTLSADDTAGSRAVFVIEAKAQRLSMTKTLAELDAALSNHSALAAIAVFSSQGAAPTASPFWFSGNRAIVVLDEDEMDLRVLRVAYEWARWVSRRSLQGTTDCGAFADEIQDAVTRTRQALKRHQTIKACHSAIRNKADEAKNQVAELVSEVDDAMAQLVASINRLSDAA